MNTDEKLVTLGNPNKQTKVISLTASGLGANTGILSEQANEVMHNELKNRRELLSKLALELKGTNYLADLKSLSSKQMKKHTKGFITIYRYVESLGLERYVNGFKLPPKCDMKRIITTLNSMTCSSNFAKLNFKDVNTDYFKLTLALLVVLKDISIRYSKLASRDGQIQTQFNLAAADIGERLYSMYVDDRMESVMDDPNLICR